MKNFYFVGALAAAFLVGGLVGYVLHKPVEEADFGATNPSTTVISLYSSLNKRVLFDSLNTLLMDVTAVRAPHAGLAVASSSVSWGTIPNHNTVSSTVINVPGGGTVGDLCLVEPAAAASSSAAFRCEITTTGTTNASATIYLTTISSSSMILANPLTTRIWVLPVSSFVAPAAIRTSTSTSY